MTAETKREVRPFVKWVGGKRQLLGELRKYYPQTINRYFEPFVGGGAVFFDLLHPEALLSDFNQELVDTYIAVRDRVEDVIRRLAKHVYEKDYFYQIRALDPKRLKPVDRAARLIYLNRAGFNGLYRVNSKGQFNVPFGRYKNPILCNKPVLRACSTALKTVEIECAPFARVLERAQTGDFVYFDPPYIPVSDTAYFTAYQRNGFGMDNQEKLAQVFDELSRRGIKAVLSNSDVPWIHDRYAAYKIRVVKARRNVNSDATKRATTVGETIVSNFNPTR